MKDRSLNNFYLKNNWRSVLVSEIFEKISNTTINLNTSYTRVDTFILRIPLTCHIQSSFSPTINYIRLRKKKFIIFRILNAFLFFQSNMFRDWPWWVLWHIFCFNGYVTFTALFAIRRIGSRKGYKDRVALGFFILIWNFVFENIEGAVCK